MWRGKWGVSKHTIYAWKAKYGGMDVSQAQEAKQLRDENTRLRKLVADLSLDKDALQWVICVCICRSPLARDAQEGCFSRIARTWVLVRKFSRISGGDPTAGEDSIHLPMAFSSKVPRPAIPSATGPPVTATTPLPATARPCGKRGGRPCSVAAWNLPPRSPAIQRSGNWLTGRRATKLS